MRALLFMMSPEYFVVLGGGHGPWMRQARRVERLHEFGRGQQLTVEYQLADAAACVQGVDAVTGIALNGTFTE
jgi:hypothetical protein